MLIAEITHGIEKYMSLRPKIERGKSAQTSVHLPIFNLNNLRIFFLEE
jgi:hypothetical protein